MIDKADDYLERIRLFDSAEITRKDLDTYLTKVFGYNNSDRAELTKVKVERLDAIMESMEIEFKRSGETVWGMLNGVTHFTNHVADTKNRLDYMQVGAGFLTNNKAQKVALEMAEAILN